MSPRPGTSFAVIWFVDCTRPAMAKVWPLASSTVVSARRTVSDGTLKPLALTAPASLR